MPLSLLLNPTLRQERVALFLVVAQEVAKNHAKEWFDDHDGKKKDGKPLFGGKDEATILAILCAAWSVDATDEQAANSAMISPDAVGRYLKNHPDVSQLKEYLSTNPILDALACYTESVKTSPRMAMEFLRVRDSKRFGDKPVAPVSVVINQANRETIERISKYNPAILKELEDKE